jgi:hypothetical protein
VQIFSPGLIENKLNKLVGLPNISQYPLFGLTGSPAVHSGIKKGRIIWPDIRCSASIISLPILGNDVDGIIGLIKSLVFPVSLTLFFYR